MEELKAVITSTHTYLEEAQTSSGHAQFTVVLNSQSRSLKNSIDAFESGVTKDEAAELMELLRTNGPWTASQLHSFVPVLDRAVKRHEQAANFMGDRKPQECPNPELFFTDGLWAQALDQTKSRSQRMDDVAAFLMKMDLTNPNPACKQRLVAILGLADPWIKASAVNAKTAYTDLSDALSKARPPPKSRVRPHLVSYPLDPSSACDVIENFAERVYGDGEGPSDNPPYTSDDIEKNVRESVLRWSNKAVREDAPLQRQQTTVLQRQATAPLQLALDPGANMPPNRQAQQQMAQMQQMMMASQMAMASMMMPGMMMPGMMMPGMAQGPGQGMMPGMAPGMMPGVMPGMMQGVMAPGVQMPGAAQMMQGGGGGRLPGAKALMNGFGAVRGGRMQNNARLALEPAPGAAERAAEEKGEAEQDDGEDHACDEGDDNPDREAERDELTTLEDVLAKGKTTAKSPPGVKATAKAKAAGAGAKADVSKRPAAAGGAKVLKKPAAGVGEPNPHWGHEASREQVMCRTGLKGPGQCHAIKWEIAGGKRKAEQMADEWVKKQRAKFGL